MLSLHLRGDTEVDLRGDGGHTSYLPPILTGAMKKEAVGAENTSAYS